VRREELFNRSGNYRFLLDSNVLLHREATAAATEVLRSALDERGSVEPLKVLDLACGGWPLAIAGVMAAVPEQAFEYTGVDINPDQVELAATLFEFSANVEPVRVLEGNAWDLGPLEICGEYDLIFSGMNLHHGNPQELLYLAEQLRGLLARGGLLISHDVYRPESQPYRRRPDRNPDNPAESFRLVDPRRFPASGDPLLDLPEDPNPGEPRWRRDYLETMGRTLLARGGDAVGTESTVAHMRQRDFPVSTRELSKILSLAGLRTHVRRFDDSGEPLAPYVACCFARGR
jgi:SAM-dependent methyltransferase